MILSYNWLKEFVPDLSRSAEEVAALLTHHSFETTVQKHIAIDEAVRVVKIKAIVQHPNADRLQLVTVDNGETDIQVVCGATNMQVGDVVPYAPPGATMQDETGATTMVRRAKIRGIESPGMLNSLRELGLAPLHSGLFILPPTTPVGSALAEHIPHDIVLEADITPNRAHDCLSHRGIAREIARLLDLPFRDPAMLDLAAMPAMPQWTFEVSPAVTQYLGVRCESIRLGPSPLWLQARLLTVGVRPLNNVVDITNYVMWESGNPTHAFDAAALPGTALAARWGREQEMITTLDGHERPLTPEALVITSNDTPVAIAGVMGGAASQVTATTTTLLLETATFDSAAVSRTAKAAGLITESSLRFARDLPAVLAPIAAGRATLLLQQLADARVEGKLEYHHRAPTPRVISFSPSTAARVSGIAWDEDIIQQLLIRVGADVERGESGKRWQVTVPAERMDLVGEHDLVEEVVRLHGLEKIPARTEGLTVSTPTPLPDQVRLREYVRDFLVEGGFTETYNYSFEETATAQALGALDSQALEIANPAAPDRAYLRTSLLPGLLRHLAANRDEIKKPFSRIEKALFEVGHVYRSGDGGQVVGVIEEERVAGVSVAHGDVVSVVGSLLEQLGAAATDITQDDEGLFVQQQRVGRLLTITAPPHAFLKKMPPRIVGFEVSLTQLRAADLLPAADRQPKQLATAARYTAVSKFPVVLRDLSVLVVPEVTVEQVEGVIERVGGELIAELELFDMYDASADSTATAAVPQKSLAFHISYQAPDRTLTAEEITVRHTAILTALRNELGAAPR